LILLSLPSLSLLPSLVLTLRLPIVLILILILLLTFATVSSLSTV